MQRRNFLGKLLKIGAGITAAAVVTPVMGKTLAEKNETFTLEDAFIPCDGNSDMYYLKKDSLLNRELMKALGERYLPKDKFGNYSPIWEQYVPIKDEYTIEDFRQLIMLIEDAGNRFRYYCDGQLRDAEVGLMRMIKDRKGKFYKMDLFEAYKHGQYGPKD